jgi:hypothetical protein
MNKSRLFLTALVFTALYSGVVAAAPALDAAGKCRDNGKFVKASLCTTTAPAPGKCRDMKTKKFAKCGAAGTEPVPTSSAK